MPRGYERKTTPHGQVYWMNRQTGESTWHDPRFKRTRTPRQSPPTATGPLPSGWEQRETSTGRTYYINHHDRTTQFTDPRLAKQPTLPKKENLKKLTLHEKLQMLRSDLIRQFENGDHGRNKDVALKIKVDRNDVFESSFQSISRIPNEHLHKRLLIKVKNFS